MRELGRCPNVTVKLGGILMSLANFDFRAANRLPTSDEPGGLWRRSSSDERAVIFYGTARRRI